MSEGIEVRSKRRLGRGRLVSVCYSEAGQTDNEPRSVDEALSQLALRGPNHLANKSVVREARAAAERLEHVLAGLPTSHQRILRAAQGAVLPEMSLNQLAKEVGVYPAQLSRAFTAARRADKLRLFKSHGRPLRSKAQLVTYEPRGVPHELVMMTHRGPVLSYLGLDHRTTVGGVVLQASEQEPVSPRDPEPELAKGDSGNGHLEPAVPGTDTRCEHTNRKWVRVAFADLRKTCRDCRAELGQTNPFSHP